MLHLYPLFLLQLFLLLLRSLKFARSNVTLLYLRISIIIKLWTTFPRNLKNALKQVWHLPGMNFSKIRNTSLDNMGAICIYLSPSIPKEQGSACSSSALPTAKRFLMVLAQCSKCKCTAGLECAHAGMHPLYMLTAIPHKAW